MSLLVFLFWVAAPMESRYCSSDIVITAFKSFLRLFDGCFHIVWPIQIVYWLWCHSYTLIDNDNNNNLESRKHIITFGWKLDGTFSQMGLRCVVYMSWPRFDQICWFCWFCFIRSSLFGAIGSLTTTRQSFSFV